jgi:hypothetical protein
MQQIVHKIPSISGYLSYHLVSRESYENLTAMCHGSSFHCAINPTELLAMYELRPRSGILIPLPGHPNDILAMYTLHSELVRESWGTNAPEWHTLAERQIMASKGNPGAIRGQLQRNLLTCVLLLLDGMLRFLLK